MAKSGQQPAQAQNAQPLDLSALVAQAVAQALAAQAAAAPAPAPAPVAAPKAAVAKPKASLDGAALFKSLQGKPGVELSATKTGRAKITAFCGDGTIVTVMAAK